MGTAVNPLYDLIDQRATCRAFRSDPIPEEVLARVLAAGCKSPSAGGFQTLSIVKVTDPEKRRELARLCRGQQLIAAAPVSLVLCVDYHRMAQVLESEPAPFQETDQFENLVMSVETVAICAQTMVLAAQAEGLGSCYIGNVLNRMAEVGALLELPRLVLPVLMLTLGWPKSPRKQPPKYAPALLVHENTYQERPAETVYAAYRQQNRWQKFTASDKQVERCCALARRLHGPAFAQRVREDILQKGWLGPYQYWLGCYYTYQDLPGGMTNAGYREYMKQQGFQWLETEKEQEET